jgi:4-hydroxy 2-oxovalerate aldolase
MDNIKLLDCTLRDGGYINDWNFGNETLINVFERIVSSGIDFIEVGFLDDRRAFDINRSIMPHSDSVEKIYGGLDKKQTEVVGMIDFGTCKIENIQPCESCFLDGIRVIFKKQIMKEALAFCQQIKDLGYKVFAQLVSITSYNDEEILQLIDLVNQVNPFAVSIVDTYGLLHKEKLLHYYHILNEKLNSSIGLGYHSHNNFQLGYANSIELINHHLNYNAQRVLLIDGTIFGMGKGAGNAPIELLAMYSNENLGKKYDINHILEAIDCSILDIFKHSPWGYSMKYFISASNDCHPNYVSFLLDKKTLSVKSINQILKKLEGDSKLLYNQATIEKLYFDYQKNDCEDTADYQLLSKHLKDQKIMLMGPGQSIETEQDQIKNSIKIENPIIISINYIPDFCTPNYLFLTNTKRYIQQATLIHKLQNKIQIIATSNVTKSSGNFDYQLDYESLIEKDAVFKDNSLIMLLKALIKMGVNKVSLAGFDGYDESKKTNFYLSKMEYDFLKTRGNEINDQMITFLNTIKENMDIKFITTSVYTKNHKPKSTLD